MPESDLQEYRDRSHGLGWLCPTVEHRARMLDMGPRIVRARSIAAAAIAVGMLAAIATGEMAWWSLALLAIAVINLATLAWQIEKAIRPERVVAANLLLILWLLGGCAAVTGHGVSPLLAWLAIPVPMAAVRFRAQVVWALAGCAALTALVVAFIGGVGQAADHPITLIGVFVLLIAVTASSTALMDAELQFRSQSVLDPLTGLLNRSGLEARFAEVSEQARHGGEPVCLITCDLDHFKGVNDTHGHERGDAVLREVSHEMRKCLRSFDLFYRLGGDEFLVLLPGVDLPRGVDIADSLREAVAASCAGGLTVTASFGVSIAIGNNVDFLALYTTADRALYRAKAAGGNLVVAYELAPQIPDDSPSPADDRPAMAHDASRGGTLGSPFAPPAGQ
jgi:diguanylate cyclase (GGDEF)-like protein